MRPTGTRQSALRAPLNPILGTEANVRILRLLTDASGPITGAQLAREVGLSPPGAYRALAVLSSRGVVERLGSGSRGLFQLRRSHPLARALTALFEAERKRMRNLVDDLRAATSKLRPPPRSVWLYGAVADKSDRAGDPIQLAVVAGSKDIEQVVEALRDRVARLERAHDVRVDLRALTEADIATATDDERHALASAIVISGIPPSAVLDWPPGTARHRAHEGQAGHDEHLLQLAAAVAEKVKHDPGVVMRARRYIRRRLPAASSGERKELGEWDRILKTMSAPQLQQFLVDKGETAVRLRQSMPFFEERSHPHA